MAVLVNVPDWLAMLESVPESAPAEAPVSPASKVADDIPIRCDVAVSGGIGASTATEYTPIRLPVKRPIKIDPADGPCEICAEWQDRKAAVNGDGTMARHCDGCAGVIAGTCYESQTVHHYHLGAIKDANCWMPIHRELCLECYRLDFAAKYPGVKVPV